MRLFPFLFLLDGSGLVAKGCKMKWKVGHRVLRLTLGHTDLKLLVTDGADSDLFRDSRRNWAIGSNMSCWSKSIKQALLELC